MKYDFITLVDRSKMGASKWDVLPADRSADTIPFSVADMELKTRPR